LHPVQRTRIASRTTTAQRTAQMQPVRRGLCIASVQRLRTVQSAARTDNQPAAHCPPRTEHTAPAALQMDTYMYIACLRQVVAFAPKVIIACRSASGRGFAFAKQGNKMRSLRRRNHEWAEEWEEGLQTICTITMSVRG
jgi:hypothetical protein